MAFTARVKERLSDALRCNDAARMLDKIAAGGYSTNSTHSYGTAGTTSGISVVEYGNAAMHKTIITLDEVEITINNAEDVSSSTDAAYGTVPLYTFPQAHIFLVGSHMVFPLGYIVAGDGGIVDTADLEIGVGTTARTQGTNFALQTNEDNIVPGQNGVDLVAGISDAIESSQSTAVLISDGSASAATANLNVVVLEDADVSADDTLTVSGTITMIWSAMGDD